MAVGFGLGVFLFIRSAGRISAGLAFRLREAAFGRLQELEFGYFDRRPSGWLVSRITSDSARMAGALAGAGAVALFGIAAAYSVVTLLYVLSFVLSTQVVPTSSTLIRAVTPPSSPWQDLRSAAVYVWQRPALMGGMSMAFLANLVAFPLFIGLLPYVAKNIYGVGQGGLGWLGASFAGGALVGSVLLSSNRLRVGAARLMLVFGMGWLVANALQAQTTSLLPGMGLLALAGFAQSLCMTPLAAVMLRATEPSFRGRVMGMRMLGIWGLPMGLMMSGPLIEHFGFQVTMTGYALVGMVLTVALGWRWRQVLWHDDRPL